MEVLLDGFWVPYRGDDSGYRKVSCTVGGAIAISRGMMFSIFWDRVKVFGSCDKSVLTGFPGFGVLTFA